MQIEKLTDEAFIAKVMQSAKAFDEANAVKQRARATGYVHALSLYGVLTDKTSGRSEYRRIEVLSNVFWTDKIVELIYRFFQKIKPAKTYTIWLYSEKHKGLLLVGVYD
jgi:hypothetical protein